jgi:hypothetical protein
LECLLGGRDRQSPRGDRADYLPAVHAWADEAHTREENKANRLGKPMERRIFPKGKDKIGKNGGVAYEDMRWSRLKNRDPATMFAIVSEHVFPFLRSMRLQRS